MAVEQIRIIKPILRDSNDTVEVFKLAQILEKSMNKVIYDTREQIDEIKQFINDIDGGDLPPALENRIKSIEDDVSSLEQCCSEVQGILSGYGARFETIDSELSSQGNRITDVENRLNVVESNIQALSNSVGIIASDVVDLKAKNVSQDTAISNAQTTANGAVIVANGAVSVNATQNRRLDALEAATPPPPTSITTTSTTFPAGYNDNVCVIEYTGTAAVTWSLPAPSTARRASQRRLTIINNSSNPNAQITLSGAVDNASTGFYPVLPARYSDETLDSIATSSAGLVNAYDFIPSNESAEWTLISPPFNNHQIIGYRTISDAWVIPALYYISGCVYEGSATTTWTLPTYTTGGIDNTAKTLTLANGNTGTGTLIVTGWGAGYNAVTLTPRETVVAQATANDGWIPISFYSQNTPKAVIVETYRNSRGWYRKYSDGWIEQGDHYIIPTFSSSATFSIPFKTPFTVSDYYLSMTIVYGGNWENVAWLMNDASVNYFNLIVVNTAGQTSDNVQIRWYACGR